MKNINRQLLFATLGDARTMSEKTWDSSQTINFAYLDERGELSRQYSSTLGTPDVNPKPGWAISVSFPGWEKINHGGRREGGTGVEIPIPFPFD